MGFSPEIWSMNFFSDTDGMSFCLPTISNVNIVHYGTLHSRYVEHVKNTDKMNLLKRSRKERGAQIDRHLCDSPRLGDLNFRRNHLHQRNGAHKKSRSDHRANTMCTRGRSCTYEECESAHVRLHENEQYCSNIMITIFCLFSKFSSNFSF